MKFKYSLKGLDCPNCAVKLQAMMEKIDGVDSAKITFLTEKITLESSLEEEQLLTAVRKCAADFSGKIVIEK